MADITEYISGSIFNYFDTLDGKPKVKNIIVYVEGDDDIPFWTNVLSTYSNYSFKVTPNRAYKVNGEYPNGKTALLNIPNLKKDKIICIDADLDLIVENYSTFSKIIKQSHYIINTQFYAIENVLSQAPLLSVIVKKVTGEDTDYDFDTFLKSFSNAIADLFLLYLADIKEKRRKFSLEDFKSYINKIHPNSPNFDENLYLFRLNYHQQLKSELANHKKSIDRFKQRLKSMGYKERDTYRLMQGHVLYNSIIRELLLSLCKNILNNKLKAKICSNTTTNCQELKNEVFGCLAPYDHKLRNYIDSVFENNEVVRNYIPKNLKSKLNYLYSI